jgi:ABC-type microcin C transport system permease subunit YejB
MNRQTLGIVLATFVLFGCANDAPLGQSVAKLKHEQTYDHNATANNLGVVPTGTGARMQVAYDEYAGQSAYDGKAETVLGKDLVQQRRSSR